VQTPAQRNEVASHLVGLIHLKREEIAGISILVPTLWRRTSRGLNALTSDGLASVLPHRPRNNKLPLVSCLGRRWFIKELLLNNGTIKCDPHLKKIITKSFFSADGSGISDDFIERLKDDAKKAESVKKNPLFKLLNTTIKMELKDPRKCITELRGEIARALNKKMEDFENIKSLATEWDLRGE
jgi:hypothetical protein